MKSTRRARGPPAAAASGVADAGSQNRQSSFGVSHPLAKKVEISPAGIAPSRMTRQRAPSSVRSMMVEATSRGEVPPSTRDPRAIDDPKRLPQAQHTMIVSSPRSGYLESLQCEQGGITKAVKRKN